MYSCFKNGCNLFSSHHYAALKINIKLSMLRFQFRNNFAFQGKENHCVTLAKTNFDIKLALPRFQSIPMLFITIIITHRKIEGNAISSFFSVPLKSSIPLCLCSFLWPPCHHSQRKGQCYCVCTITPATLTTHNRYFSERREQQIGDKRGRKCWLSTHIHF